MRAVGQTADGNGDGGLSEHGLGAPVAQQDLLLHGQQDVALGPVMAKRAGADPDDGNCGEGRRLDRRDRHGTARVTTRSPGRTASMGRAPAGSSRGPRDQRDGGRRQGVGGGGKIRGRMGHRAILDWRKPKSGGRARREWGGIVAGRGRARFGLASTARFGRERPSLRRRGGAGRAGVAKTGRRTRFRFWRRKAWGSSPSPAPNWHPSHCTSFPCHAKVLIDG